MEKLPCGKLSHGKQGLQGGKPLKRKMLATSIIYGTEILSSPVISVVRHEKWVLGLRNFLSCLEIFSMRNQEPGIISKP